MSSATFETQIGPDGVITLHIPASVAKANQKVRVMVQPQEAEATADDDFEARLARLEALYGSMPNFPEYVRGSEGPPREIEAIE